jgi:hypothetical protein
MLACLVVVALAAVSPTGHAAVWSWPTLDAYYDVAPVSPLQLQLSSVGAAVPAAVVGAVVPDATHLAALVLSECPLTAAPLACALELERQWQAHLVAIAEARAAPHERGLGQVPLAHTTLAVVLRPQLPDAAVSADTMAAATAELTARLQGMALRYVSDGALSLLRPRAPAPVVYPFPAVPYLDLMRTVLANHVR